MHIQKGINYKHPLTLFNSQLGAKFAQFQLEWIFAVFFFFLFLCIAGFFFAVFIQHTKKERYCTIEMNFWALWIEKVWSTNKKRGKGQKSGNLLMFWACLGFELSEMGLIYERIVAHMSLWSSLTSLESSLEVVLLFLTCLKLEF